MTLSRFSAPRVVSRFNTAPPPTVLQVKENFSSVPREVRSAFLPAVAVASYLRRLQRAQFNLFHPGLQRRDGWLPARLWWRSRRGKL